MCLRQNGTKNPSWNTTRTNMSSARPRQSFLRIDPDSNLYSVRSHFRSTRYHVRHNLLSSLDLRSFRPSNSSIPANHQRWPCIRSRPEFQASASYRLRRKLPESRESTITAVWAAPFVRSVRKWTRRDRNSVAHEKAQGQLPMLGL